MSARTHWKQRWNPEAPLIFARRLRMGSNPKKPFVLPGDKVTKKMREQLGLNRLKNWFANGTVVMSDFVAPDAQRKLAIAERVNAEEQAASNEPEAE